MVHKVAKKHAKATRKAHEKKQKVVDTLHSNLCWDMRLIVSKFLSPIEILTKLQPLSKKWRYFTLDPKIWYQQQRQQLVIGASGINLSHRLRMVRKIVERRSKGHTYICQDRVTKEALTVRRVYLDIANAGKDDGLPASLLREISFLQGLHHPNIARLASVQVEGTRVQLVHEHLDWNLKEFIRRNMVLIEPQSQFLKLARKNRPLYTLPLPEIKNAVWQILLGLNHCHSRGIMHRNLKPDNILVQ